MNKWYWRVVISSFRDPPDSGIEPASPVAPTQAGGFFITEPPGKSGDDLVMFLKYASGIQESSQG